jgi:hypothetical protein
MDLSSWARSNSVILATLAVFIGLIVFSTLIFKPLFQSPQIVFVEDPLEKNMDIQLFPGESHRYSFLFNQTEINITYAILPGKGCTRIRLLERANDSETCIDYRGNDEGGFNSTFRNPSIMLFKPWMLALKEGWRWKSTMYLSYDGALSRVSETNYRVIRSEEYRNRTAFIIEIKSEDNYSEYQWIDAEKRILLKSIGDGYEVKKID